FTPCYNSEKFLHRVFDSLKAQSYKNFEWLVVNDASTDSTASIIYKYMEDADFDVKFINLDRNQMLMRNYNLAIREAEGELFIPAGHDDSFEADALQTFYELWQSIPMNERQRYAGIICNCKDQFGRLIGDPFPYSPFETSLSEMRFRHKIRGEKWQCIVTDVMKEFPFPTVDKYVPESTVWYAIGTKYRMIAINDCLRTYFINQPDSLCSQRQIKYPVGMRYAYLDLLNNYVFSELYDPKQITSTLINYVRMSIHSGQGFVHTITAVNSLLKQILTSAAFFGGLIVALSDRIQRRI
ncbi:MAG: glycosyltransferase family 2 protein, partial [Syntrophomonadaceae bacterium]|nr:glycosyltransferase family 2 protein [Syntrophomonadaceae bacterium]